VKDARGLNLEIVEKVKRMITSSTELKGLDLSSEDLVNLGNNVASEMYDTITDSLKHGDGFMVYPHITLNESSVSAGHAQRSLQQLTDP
jgi:acetyltransferase-like isoleucine patch superfamily enzyme